MVQGWRGMALVCMALAGLLHSTNGYTQGKFVVLEPEVSTPELKAEVDELHGLGVLQEFANSLNALFVIPKDVSLRYSECEESNAYFYPEILEISMCIELLQDMDETFAESYPDEDERNDAVAGAFTAILLHEVGHALVEVLEVPITGREEDAVDQLSAWVLIENGMADAVLSSAETYYAEEDATDDDETLADEHSLNRQRYFNMVCWVYGSDPETHKDLAAEWELPEARAEKCADEYELIKTSWERLLDGHLRE